MDGASKCPGCGGENFYESRPKCGVISCLKKHGDYEYCFMCGEYICEKYEKDSAKCDSFITHKNMRKDFIKARDIGIEAYKVELDEKMEILERLLNGYNDGRKKSLYCLSVNLLDIEDLRSCMERLHKEVPVTATVKEKALTAVNLLEEKARVNGIELKLTGKA
jgi:hypothetical protein